MKQIDVVGIGLDGVAGLTPTVKTILETATLIVGSSRHLEYVTHLPAQKLILSNIEEVICQVEQLEDKAIVILASGDPLLFGIGRVLLTKLGSDRLRFHPHLSSLQLAFSRIKLPWQDAEILSIHGRSIDPLIPLLQQGKKKIALLTDSQNHPGAVASVYLALGLPHRYCFYICENLGGSEEHISTYSSNQELNKLSSQPSDAFAPLNLVILTLADNPTPDLAQLPLLGLEDSTFLTFGDRPGLISKKEVRMLILGQLCLKNGQTVWDVGAGTGAVAIEVARLCPSSTVYAIEQTAVGYNLIRQNAQRLGVDNLTAIHGKAPEALLQLPSPQTVFIGGSGGELGAILDLCASKLAVDGRIVLAIATLEHLQTATNWLKERGWHYQLLQVQLSRSVPVSHLTRFAPLNPVTIVTASRKPGFVQSSDSEV